MESKENPTTTGALSHEVRPEHKILRDAMMQWSNQADGETRSAIVIQVSEKDGELTASSHINGNSHHLVHAIAACMSAITPDNPVGAILRAAAIRSLQETGMIAPAAAPEQSQDNDETRNNTEDNE